MNATGDSEDNPELLTPGTPGLPLSAPVAAGMLQTREPSVYFREPDDSPRPHGGAAHAPVPVQAAGLPHGPAAYAPAVSPAVAPATTAPRAAHAAPAAMPVRIWAVWIAVMVDFFMVFLEINWGWGPVNLSQIKVD